MAPKRTETDKAIDRMLDGLDIISAYNRYAHKGTVDPKGKTEGIMCSCPNPNHPDRNPSAWINLDKQTWFCGGCNEGGDKYDIAAWHFGLPVPGYKDGRNFHDLRKRIAEDHGFTFQRTIAGEIAIPPSAPVGPPSPSVVGSDSADFTDEDGRVLHLVKDSAPITAPDDGMADVTELPGDVGGLEVEDIELEWKSIVPAGTFLDAWMKQTTIDDVPEEYHFWNGLLAISMTLGRDVTLRDFRPVYGNLFVCILGRSGSGKSKSKYYLDQLIDAAIPYSARDPHSKGALRISGVASAEALIWMFQKKVDDPTAPAGTPPKSYPVRGIIDYNELASMVGRGQRAGNVLIPTMMQFFDVEDTIETISRTHGREKAEMPFASAITTSQPKSLRNLLTSQDAASGFLNRWFFAGGKEKTRSAIGGVVVDVMPAVKPLSDIAGWAATAGSLSWSQGASDTFTKFFHDTLQPIMRADDSDLLSRLDLLCKKLVLLFTANMKADQVPVEAVDQMMKMLPYVLECYGVPGAHVGNSMQSELRTNILKVIVDHQTKTGKGPTARDISRRLSRRNYPLDLFNRTLKYMMEIEEIIVLPHEGPGRPTTRYSVLDTKEWDFKPKRTTEAMKDKMRGEAI